ncbi:MAG: carbamoyltransferase HypF, partial [Chloroflexi bacterium]|nr:carbamoyltransferase HypF [Chloroflexota bacterium]
RQGSPHPDPLPGGEGVEGKGVGARDGEVAPDTVASTARLLREGRILALKGLGGFHLACDATDEAAVRRLRERKRRPHKPLALMMADMDEVRRHCLASAEEEDLLRSPQVPIVLLPWRADSCVAQAVAPGNRYLGVMLPYTPLHHLLLRDVGRPLVMTSGNLSEEPIAKDNDEARRRLSGIADAFLLHNRDIYARYDDSVFLVECGAPRPIRRARGYAPFPVRLPFRARQALACGAELKNTFCLTKDEYAFVSQHIGDLENLETLEHFQDTLALYERLFRIQPELVAYDLHPDYLATQFALEQPLPGVGVQHHHAHIVACMAENGARGPVIGVALDGTGYGTDGTIWGGEFLLAEYSRFQRLGHLQALPMPGGAAAIERPYRMAYAYLKALLGEVPPDLGFLAQVPAAEQALMAQQMEQGLNAPLTSSCGRLFDGVSALLGVRGVANYEAQAAIELEMAAADVEGTYPYCIIEHNGVLVVELAPLFGELVAELRRGRPVPEMAGRFHNTVAALTLDVCRRLREITGTGTVALSGGVFQNRRLFRQVNDLLAADGFEVLNHRQVPCNDGGISLGQAVVASSTLW